MNENWKLKRRISWDLFCSITWVHRTDFLCEVFAIGISFPIIKVLFLYQQHHSFLRIPASLSSSSSSPALKNNELFSSRLGKISLGLITFQIHLETSRQTKIHLKLDLNSTIFFFFWKLGKETTLKTSWKPCEVYHVITSIYLDYLGADD